MVKNELIFLEKMKMCSIFKPTLIVYFLYFTGGGLFMRNIIFTLDVAYQTTTLSLYFSNLTEELHTELRVALTALREKILSSEYMPVCAPSYLQTGLDKPSVLDPDQMIEALIQAQKNKEISAIFGLLNHNIVNELYGIVEQQSPESPINLETASENAGTTTETITLDLEEPLLHHSFSSDEQLYSLENSVHTTPHLVHTPPTVSSAPHTPNKEKESDMINLEVFSAVLNAHLQSLLSLGKKDQHEEDRSTPIYQKIAGELKATKRRVDKAIYRARKNSTFFNKNETGKKRSFCEEIGRIACCCGAGS